MRQTHGTAKLNENILAIDGTIHIEKGEEGFITAYLPEMETFAVMFPDNKWITFKESEENFLKRCECKR